MIRNGLYNKLSYILDSYKLENNQYEITEYNHPSITKITYCSSPRITLSKTEKYIEAIFEGYFHYYLDLKKEKYFIRIFNNDNIKHNFPWRRREIINNVIDFLSNDAYKKAEEARAERKEKERIQSINDEFKRKHKSTIEMAKEILFNFGKVYRTDDINDYNAPITEECSYEGYGLHISACDLPGFVFTDETTGYLLDSIKKHMNKISIKYNNKQVFVSGANIYVEGIWEEILKELYRKLPILKQQKDRIYQEKKHCTFLMDSIITTLHNKGISEINNSIKIRYYTKLSSRINNCGSYETDYHYVVTKNGKTVFHVVETTWHNYQVYEYVPGTWEDELKNYLVEYEIKQAKKAEEDGLKYINQLRKIR